MPWLFKLSGPRSAFDGGLMLALMLAALTASTLLAGGPIYLDAIERAAISREVSTLPPAAAGSWVHVTDLPQDQGLVRAVDVRLEAAADQYGPLLVGTKRVFRSSRLGVRNANATGAGRGASFNYQSMPDLWSHVKFSDGTRPSPVVDRTPAPGQTTVEVALVGDVAARYGYTVGDDIDLAAGEILLSRAHVTGLFSPLDTADEYWLNLAGDLLALPSPDSPLLQIIGFAEEAAVFNVARRASADTGEAWWLAYQDPAEASRLGVGEVRSRIEHFESEAVSSVSNATVFTGMNRPFQVLDRQLLYVRLPILAGGGLLVGLAGYLLIVIAGSFASRRDYETQLLYRRGVTRVQMLTTRVLEALVILIPATLAAPPIAAWAISHLGTTSAFNEVTGGGPLDATLTWTDFALSAGAGLVTIATLAAVSAGHSRKRTTSPGMLQKTLRTERPFFQRYYIDLAVLVAGGVAVWEVARRGDFALNSENGGVSADAFALFAPALIAIGVILLGLRVVPILFDILARTVAMVAPPVLTVSMWTLARSPFEHAWFVVLLAIVASLATFGATVPTSLENDARSRINFGTPSDVHIAGLSGAGGPIRSENRVLAELPGVRASAFALRTSAKAGTSERAERFQLLLLQAGQFEGVTRFDNDRGGLTVHDVASLISVQSRVQSGVLPAGTTRIEASFSLATANPSIDIWLRVQDSAGITRTVPMRPEQSPDGRTVYSGDIDQESQQPLRIASVLAYEPPTASLGTEAILSMNSITAVGPRDQQELLTPELANLASSLPTSEGFDTRIEPLGDGESGAFRVVMGRGTDTGIRGVHWLDTGGAIPMVVNRRFLDSAGLAVGDATLIDAYDNLVPVRISGVTDFFPTMPGRDRPFAIADYRSVVDYMSLRGRPSLANTGELFLEIGDEAHADTLDTLISSAGPAARIDDRRQLLAQSSVSLIAVAGWDGTRLVGGVAALLLGVSGAIALMLTQSYRSRPWRAALRAVGFTSSGLMFEQLARHGLTAFLGAVAGVLVGLFISGIALDVLVTAQRDSDLTLPILTQTQWLSVLVVVGVTVGTAFIVAIAGTARDLRHPIPVDIDVVR